MSLAELSAGDVEAALVEWWAARSVEDLQDVMDEEEREDLLNEYRDSLWDELPWTLREDSKDKPVEIEGLGVVVCEQDAGGEGQGDSLSVVLKIVEGDVTRFFEKTGYYASYHGSDWSDGWFGEVEPYQEMVTRYRSKSGKKY